MVEVVGWCVGGVLANRIAPFVRRKLISYGYFVQQSLQLSANQLIGNYFLLSLLEWIDYVLVSERANKVPDGFQ